MSNSNGTALRVIVVGAGYAGLAAAIELRRRRFQVEIFEGAKDLTLLGDAIQIGSYATRIMKRWGNILDEVTKISANYPDMTYFDHKGNEIITAPLPTNFDEYPTLYCYRSRIQQLMIKHAESLGIKIRLGSRVSSYFEDDSRAGIIVKGERYEADAVIATDGAHSVARTFVTGQDVRSVPSGLAIYRCWFDLDSLRDDPKTRHYAESPRDLFHVWLGENTHVIMITNTKLRGCVCFTTHEDYTDVGDSWSWPGKVSENLKVIEGWDDVPRSIVKHIPDGRLIDWKLRWRDPNDNWVSPKGRVVLAGDAAHPHLPTSGSGAGQAIEDAATLGVLFEKLGPTGDIPLIFKAFCRMRYERTSLTARLGWETRHRWHQTDWDEVKKNPEIVKMPQPKWLYGADAEQYAYDNWEAAAKHIKEGVPFESSNLPEGYKHQPWSVTSMLADEAKLTKKMEYQIRNE